jgi:fructose-1-phosphate kinase PfkB-like protein
MTAIATLTMSPAIDLFAGTEQFYYDSKTRCEILHRAPGGGGINVARNLRCLGLDVLAVFPAGGHHGDLLEQLLVDDGLPVKRSVSIMKPRRISPCVRPVRASLCTWYFPALCFRPLNGGPAWMPSTPSIPCHRCW